VVDSVYVSVIELNMKFSLLLFGTYKYTLFPSNDDIQSMKIQLLSSNLLLSEILPNSHHIAPPSPDELQFSNVQSVMITEAFEFSSSIQLSTTPYM
jgi:hypothetical protein